MLHSESRLEEKERIAGLRSGFAAIKSSAGEKRSPERLRAHFILETCLADRLKNAPSSERPKVYGEVYDQLFDSLPDHPQHEKRQNPNGRSVAQCVKFLMPYLPRLGTLVELGCGDGAVSFAAAPFTREVIGADVQDKLLDYRAAPFNFRFVKLIDGIALPFESDSVDVISSDQLLEHLHPDDARLQLAEVFRVLKPGGIYLCSTPSAITGPHDISMYFCDVACGLHLKEYKYREIRALFASVGFVHIDMGVRIHGRQLNAPIGIGVFLEKLLELLQPSFRHHMVRTRLVDRLMGINVIARK